MKTLNITKLHLHRENNQDVCKNKQTWCVALGDLTLAYSLFLVLKGHIGIAVPDVYAACKLFEEQGVTFVKKPDDG